MKKWIFKPILLLVVSILIVFACEREEFTVKEAIDAQNEVTELIDSLEYVRDSLQRMAGVIHYTVNVVNMSDATASGGTKSVTSIAGATVTTSQHGVIVSKTTSDNGIVVFDDLRIGNITVSVKADGYTTVDYEAFIQAENDTTVLDYYGIYRNMATMVPVFSTTENLATIAGIVTLDSDLTNKVKETLSGIVVVANIQPENLSIDCEGCYSGQYGRLWGTITSSVYHGTQNTSTTDATGAYSVQVPATPDGLDVEIEVSEYATDQSILLNEYSSERVTGVQSVRTYFNSDYTASGIPDVPGAYAEFSDPTGTVAAAPSEMAFAEAHVGESGLMSIDINTVGTGYTQAPMLIVSKPDNPMGTRAEAVANLVDGRVTSIDVVESGSGYTSYPLSVYVLDDVGEIWPGVGQYGVEASADVTMAYSVIEFVMQNQGDGYTNRPNVTINSPAGSGASGQAVLSGYVSDVVLADGGSGYICPPQALASYPETGDDNATFNVNMSDYHPLHSILVNDDFDGGPYETAPEVLITPTAEGSGATAIAQLENAGLVLSISINNPGAGYTVAPTVNIVGGGGFGAEAYTTISGGSISGIIVMENGQDYTSLPTIQISAPPAGGTQATAEAVLAYDLESIILTNPGSGYDVYYSASDPDDYENEPTVSVDGTGYAEGSTKITVRPNMSVEGITVSNDGSRYESIPTITFNSNCGEGSGATATAELLYRIFEIQLIAGGSGYLDENDVTVSIDIPENGTPATARENLGDGIVQSIDLTEGGEGYTASPYVFVNRNRPPDVDAEISTTLSIDGEITGFTIINSGQGYRYWTGYSIDIYTHMPGGTPLNVSGRVFENAGIIERIEVTNPGAGYTVAPQVEFLNEGTGGTGATAVATIENGRVSGVEITNPGSGYIDAPDINLFGVNYIERAVAICQVNDLGRITGVNFSLGSIDFLTRGNGYLEGATVTFYPQIAGIGQGAEAKIVVENGKIEDVIMLNQGKGYTSSNYPKNARPFQIWPDNDDDFSVISNKSYIKDIYLGTGKREI